MVATPEVRATQGRVLAGVGYDMDLRVTQAITLTAINYPTEMIRSTQARIIAGVKYSNDIQTSQVRVLTACRGRIENPRLRAWTYTLDGHDMYVLRLGDIETLVYDTYSEQWSTYASGERDFWRANTGINWLGAEEYAEDYGSNVLVGDDTFGILWILDPEQGYDDHPRVEITDPQPFTRTVMGQIPLSGRDKVQCFQLFLDCDVGAPSNSGTSVTLYTSDDAGHTFDNQGNVSIILDDFSQEVFWSSLGQIKAPGRLFKIEDDGAITTIYGLDMRDGS